MIAVAGSPNISTTGVSSWAEVVRRSCGGTDLNPPPPQLPEDLEFTAESVVDVADEPASRNLDKNVSEDVSKELPEIVKDLPSTELGESSRQSSSASSPEPPVLVDGSSVAAASKECAGSDGNRKRSIMNPVGSSPPNPSPMIPHHGVVHYQYGYHPGHVVPQYYTHPRDGHFVQGRRGNHSNFAHVRPPVFWSTSRGFEARGAHRPPFYIGQGTGYMIAYPPPPWPYWDIMHRPDFWGMPFRPLPHHLPPASMFYPAVSIPNDPTPSRIVKQIDYYFSEPNLVKDLFLRSKMDSEGWVPISLIAGFPRVKQLTKSIPFILRSLRSSKVVEVQGNRIRKRDNWKKWLPSLDENNKSQ